MKFLTRMGIICAALSVLSGCHLRARSKVADKVAFHDNLRYRTDTGPSAEFDLYVPKGAASGNLVPAIVFIHGGYWRNQTRRYYQAFTGLYQNFGLSLASKGIATAVIDYRIFPEGKLSDQVDDVVAAVAYIKKNAATYGIDSNRIYAVGHSAGGHLALLAAWQRKDPDIRGVVALSPILDVAHMRQHKEADFNRELTVPFFGKGDADASYSPASFATPLATPALILFGDKDYDYLREQAKTYAEGFAKSGFKQITFGTIAKADHSDMVLSVHTSEDKVSDAIAAFIQRLK
jgi:arylformamidase